MALQLRGILPIGLRCQLRLKFLGPYTPPERLCRALVGGKDGPIISGGHTEALELHLMVVRRRLKRGSPQTQNSSAGVRGGLERLGVGSINI